MNGWDKQMKFEGIAFITKIEMDVLNSYLIGGFYNGDVKLDLIVRCKGPDEMGSSFGNLKDLSLKKLKITLENIEE